jgi:anaerobic selenocysteine-containing dehydrogenase
MLELKRKGESKLLVVDCRRTMLAKEADVHLMPLPGTDPAIALGLLNVVINEGLYDKEFVEKWTVGFDKLVDRVKDYPPERVEQLTTVPAEKLREFARIFATTKPATIFTGNTLDNVDGGLYAHRGMDILWAITGNVGARGGSRLIPMNLFTKVSCEPGKPIPLNYDDLLEDCRFVSPRKFWGEDKYPMFVSVIAGGVMSCAVDAMLEGKIKAMIIQAANMHSTWANTNRWKRAMSQLDFLVVYDIVMTEDAEFADLVLPATTFLEKQFVFNYGYRPLWALGNVAIEPPPDCRSEMWFWLELAKRMGFKDYLPFDTVDEAQNHLAGKYGLTLDDLRRNPGGVFYSKAGAMDKAYEKTGFKTPSGKVEIYSERAKEWGLDPLPTYVPPIQSPAGRPDIAKRYPLWLITGTRMIEYHESMLRCVPSLRAKQPDPLAEIHTDVARALGINDGDPVIIETLAGKCEMKAKVSEDIHPQVVSTTQGWWRMNNPNFLTMDEEGARCPETGCPIMRAIACRVVKSVMRG